jgi:hypothetical protein
VAGSRIEGRWEDGPGGSKVRRHGELEKRLEEGSGGEEGGEEGVGVETGER